MSIAEMKSEMVETINHLPDDMIGKAFDFLKQLDKVDSQSVFNQEHLDRHFARYDNVLKKLAQ